MSPAIDLTSTATAPFQATSEHRLLLSFVGMWSGPTKLWLDPAAPPTETTTELEGESVLGGRWLRLTYTGTAFEKPHAGEMLVGFHKDPGQYELAWVDSSHTGSAIMLSRGKVSSTGLVNVLGDYLAGDQRWGWRTLLSRPSDNELLMEAFNVTPDGKEELAIQSRLQRRNL